MQQPTPFSSSFALFLSSFLLHFSLSLFLRVFPLAIYFASLPFSVFSFDHPRIFSREETLAIGLARDKQR